eukprot:2863093-Amphidinium_carterae.2
MKEFRLGTWTASILNLQVQSLPCVNILEATFSLAQSLHVALGHPSHAELMLVLARAGAQPHIVRLVPWLHCGVYGDTLKGRFAKPSKYHPDTSRLIETIGVDTLHALDCRLSRSSSCQMTKLDPRRHHDQLKWFVPQHPPLHRRSLHVNCCYGTSSNTGQQPLSTIVKGKRPDARAHFQCAISDRAPPLIVEVNLIANWRDSSREALQTV